MSDIIYDILKELGLIQYWDDLPKQQLNDIINVDTNVVDETKFDQIFELLPDLDKIRLKNSLKINLDNQIEMGSDSETNSTVETTTIIIENKPSIINNLTPSPNDNTLKEPSRANDENVVVDATPTTLNSPTKKSNPDDITCIHHISYKALGPNNFVPSYTKRYYVESTGEEFYTDIAPPPDGSNLKNSTNTKSIGKVSPIYSYSHENSSSNTHNSTSYNRDYYHPYQNPQPRHYSHNRMNSEPTRHYFHGFYPSNILPPHHHNMIYNINHHTNNTPTTHQMYNRANLAAAAATPVLSPNSTVSLNNPPSSSQPDYNHHYDETTNFNNFKVYPSAKSTQLSNFCPVFEGSKAMESSPLHKYNLLDPPIFKYHSIRIPPRIPFLIRLDSLDEDRVNMIKNASIIFGRSDNRRKSTSLNLNEMLMNEVAFQLCLRDPLYLISRQKLIMESREIIRESGHRIQDDVNIIPFEEITGKNDKDLSNDCLSTVDPTNSALIDNNLVSNSNHSNINNNCNSNSNNSHSRAVTNSINNLSLSNDVKTISEVRDAPLIPYNNCNETDPFFIQDEPSSVQSRNLMAKYCYDDYDTIHYYKVHRKWPQNADSSRKAYLRRKSKKFKVIDNYLYSVSSFSERLRLWLRDVDVVMEHAPRFHLKENGEHFTRNETISRMLRYCYSNDIAQGVSKFIQTCELCMEKEWKESNGNENSMPVGLKSHNSLANHQLLSTTSQSGDSSHNHVRNMVITNKTTNTTSELTTNEDQYVYYSSDNSTENKGSSSCRNNQPEVENTTVATTKPLNLNGLNGRRKSKLNQNSTPNTKNN